MGAAGTAVDKQFVRRVRHELGLPRASAKKPEGERAEDVVRKHPEWTAEQQANEADVSKKTIYLARERVAAETASAPAEASAPRRPKPWDKATVEHKPAPRLALVQSPPAMPPTSPVPRANPVLTAMLQHWDRDLTAWERQRFIETVAEKTPEAFATTFGDAPPTRKAQ